LGPPLLLLLFANLDVERRDAKVLHDLRRGGSRRCRRVRALAAVCDGNEDGRDGPAGSENNQNEGGQRHSVWGEDWVTECRSVWGRSGLLFWILALYIDKPRAYLKTTFRVVVNVAFWA